MRLVLAARQSHLARLQAKIVGHLLEETFSDVTVEYAFRESLGDKNASDPLWQMPEKGVFTEDFLADLVEGRCDLVVHSWKDLPTEPRPDTEIVATLPRADVRDLLLLRRDRMEAVDRERVLKVLTSSPRRIYNLKPFLHEALPWELHEVEFLPVRGNVPTRLRKLLEGGGDALIVAKAAVDRLLETQEPDLAEGREAVRHALDRCHWMVLPISRNPSAAAQGALAIEVAKGNTALKERLAQINHGPTFKDVQAERAILASHGGGCHQKIGVNVMTKPYGVVTSVRGETDAGQVLNRLDVQPLQGPAPEESVSPDALWPLEPVRDAFKRIPLAVPEPAPEEARAFWVAKAGALPRDWKLAHRPLVWVSGLESWKQLAHRGVWVNGSAESLGEAEDPRVDTLCGGRPEWVKLTHDQGHASGAYPLQATYRLEPRDSFPDLTGKTHFFWASGSLFRRALAAHPEIREGNHASGPGHTHEVLREELGAGASIQVFLNHEAWLQHYTETERS